ncbi:hypothetical protein Aperf_G00000003446 [Anoplocephala perfoliata]
MPFSNPSLSLRVNNDIMHFFFEETSASFPLYQRALQFFDHSENMVRIAVRTTTLNILKDHHEACYLYVYAHTSVPYFSHLAEEIRRTILTVKDSFCLKSRLANRGCFGDLVAETSDHLHYIDDIFALGVTEPTNVPCLVLLLRLFLPIYVHSLTRRHPPKGSLCLLGLDGDNFCSSDVSDVEPGAAQSFLNIVMDIIDERLSPFQKRPQ